MRSRYLSVIALAAAALLPAAAGAQVFVDRDAPEGGNGQSWATAFNTIQEGIDAASSLVPVWVAAGDYPEVDTNNNASLNMRSNVRVFGGFTGTETAFDQRDFNANVTRILGTRDSLGDNAVGESVVRGRSGGVLDGFTITGGRALLGAGMYNEGQAPIVRNCIFTDNRSLILPILDDQGQPTGQEFGGDGGASYNFDDATPTFEDCIFDNNEALRFGGAIATNIRSHAVFIRCQFINNRGRQGGAIINERSNAAFNSCIFRDNTATRLRPQDADAFVAGGAFYNIGHLPDQFPAAETADPLLVNCLFEGNNAINGLGGAFFNSESRGRLINCTIVNNSAGNIGGFYNFDGGLPVVTNTIIWGNNSGNIFDDPTIFFGEEGPPVGDPLPATTTATASNIQGGFPGSLNLNVDPLFGEDFRLSTNSPLIDAGVTAESTIDFEGDARGFDGSTVPRGDGSEYDIGYDEFAGGIVDPVEGEGEGGDETSVVYVNAANAGGTQDGLAWATAFGTLQAGIDAAAALEGAEVWVAAGTYGEARANGGSLVLAEGVDIYGGFAGNETERTQRNLVLNLTIINGATANAGAPAASVVIGADDARLDGFAIIGGNGIRGAGMLNNGVSPFVSGCTFFNNTASEQGGAVYNSNAAAPVFENCLFRRNRSGSDGGAVATENATVTIRNPDLRDNDAQGNGGAVYNGPGSTLILEGGLARGNEALGEGGAIFNGENSTARITRVRIRANESAARGGGISNHAGSTVLIGSCLIAQNEALVHGGGINNSAASPTIVGTTISDNTATFRGAGIFNNAAGGTAQPTASGVIIWGNNGENIGNSGTGRLIANYSLLEDGISGGTGNIDANPLFVDPANNNYKLQPGSPAIDAGQSTASAALGAIIRDFELDFRGFDGDGLGANTGDGSEYDMGYDEFTGAGNTGGTPEGEFEGNEEGEEGEGVADGEGAGDGEGAPDGSVDGEGTADGEGAADGEGGIEGEGEGADVGDIVFVNKANTNPVQDGASWATAFTNLRDGIETAFLEDASEVWVAAGVYNELRPGGGTLVLRRDVAVYGGFAGSETERGQRSVAANPTIIDGSVANGGSPAQRVVQGADGARIDGFTIRGGRGASGAGMLNFEASPVVANCTFTNNEATDFGGAIFNLGVSSPLITRCTFTSNSAGESGGAITSLESAPTISDCTFRTNSSRFGGAIFNNLSGGQIVRCTFDANQATGSAGAIAILQSSPEVIGCTFTDNTALENAGALFINLGSARVEDSRFFRNNTQGSGGAIYTLGPGDEEPGETSPFIVNSIFYDNRAVSFGGAIFNNVSSPRVVNCTIYANLAVENGGGIGNFEARPNVANTILWANSGQAIHELTSLATVTFSIVQGGFPGASNIDADPLLANPAARDFRLTSGSPAIDTGRDTASAQFGNVIDDIDGNPRGINSAGGVRGDGSDYDIGAHEFGSVAEGEVEAEEGEGGTEGEGGVEGEGGAEGEGAIEGEGEGGQTCRLSSVQLLTPADNAIIVSGSGPLAIPLGFTAGTDCVEDTAAVQFALDGSVLGGTDQRPYVLLINDINTIGAGEHTASAIAFSESTGARVEDTNTFTLLAAPVDADGNSNGFPDIPLAVLLQDGDTWTSSVTVTGTGGERVTFVQRFDRPSDNGGPVVVVLSHPDNPGVQVTLRIPRAAIPNNAIGLLAAGIAPDMATLLGPQQASQISDLPEGGLVEGAPIIAAGILVSTDNGVTFSELDAERLAENPATLSIEGLSFSPDNATVQQHPVDVNTGGAQGLRIEGVFQAGWSDEAVTNITVTSDRIDATMQTLGLLAPFIERPGTSAIQVTPAQYTFGRVEVGDSRQTVFVVTNTGSGVLTGEATVTGAFRIVSGGSYALNPGQSQNVIVAFEPGDTRGYTETITFTGGNGAQRTVTGTGIPSKHLNLLGCAPGEGGAGGGMGDVLVVAMVLMAMFIHRRRLA